MSHQGIGFVPRRAVAAAERAVTRRRNRRAAERLPARDRFAYRPGNGTCLLEALEDRRLMDASGDLTTQIKSLLSSGDVSGQYSFQDISLGSFLTVPKVTVGLSNVAQLADGNWNATVSVDATAATFESRDGPDRLDQRDQ